ncbi:MAG: hypothetical protein VX745_00955 [Pseudomonadota bacterium]|nr:hypothetical protein [Pseudomonadota bacterium]
MWRPQVYDLVAHYEPRSDFSLTHSIRAAVKELGQEYRGSTLMTGAHAGTPVIHTDMRGISIGTRLEISRLAIREKDRQPLVAEVFRMFQEAAERGIASGPIDRMTVKFPNAERKPDARQPIHDAYEEVFDSPCCFQRMQDPHTLRLGRAVVHQALIHHLREDGPYHSDHQPRVERVHSELGRRPGRYEGYQYFVEPIFTPGKYPEVVFHYSGDEPSRIIEVTMRQKSEEELQFMKPETMRTDPSRFVSLMDYDQGARRFGRLWVMQEGLLRRLDREWLPLIYLFMDDDLNPMLDVTFTWEELYERQRLSPYVPRAQRFSSTFLDICIERLSERFLVLQEGGRFRLQSVFNDVQHVTFYELGHYDKRLG